MLKESFDGPKVHKLEAPRKGTTKVNCDGALPKEEKTAGIGMVTRKGGRIPGRTAKCLH